MKHLKSFKIFESQEEEEEEEEEGYKITAEDEINDQYCKDFRVADLKVGDKIYNRLIYTDDNEYQWAKNVYNLNPDELAKYSEPTEYEVVEVGSDTIKLK